MGTRTGRSSGIHSASWPSSCSCPASPFAFYLATKELTDVVEPVPVSLFAYQSIRRRRRFRRFVQVFEGQLVYFKEFGDPRIVSRKTGRAFPSVAELTGANPDDGPATEMLHFAIHNPRSSYGVPRWIGNLPSVLGSRQSEETGQNNRTLEAEGSTPFSSTKSLVFFLPYGSRNGVHITLDNGVGG